MIKTYQYYYYVYDRGERVGVKLYRIYIAYKPVNICIL